MTKIANNLAIEEFISDENSFEKSRILPKLYLNVNNRRNKICNSRRLKRCIFLLCFFLISSLKLSASIDDTLQVLLSKRISAE